MNKLVALFVVISFTLWAVWGIICLQKRHRMNQAIEELNKTWEYRELMGDSDVISRW